MPLLSELLRANNSDEKSREGRQNRRIVELVKDNVVRWIKGKQVVVPPQDKHLQEAVRGGLISVVESVGKTKEGDRKYRVVPGFIPDPVSSGLLVSGRFVIDPAKKAV